MSDVLERTLLGLRQALTVSPSNGPLWLQVAEILRELGRTNEAVEAGREAAKPDDKIKADPAAVERTRETVKMLDDLYKSAIVHTTNTYVKARETKPASPSGKRFRRARPRVRSGRAASAHRSLWRRPAGRRA